MRRGLVISRVWEQTSVDTIQALQFAAPQPCLHKRSKMVHRKVVFLG